MKEIVRVKNITRTDRRVLKRNVSKMSKSDLSKLEERIRLKNESIDSRIKTVTPEMAKAYLNNNVNEEVYKNRPIDQKNVDHIYNKLVSGEWRDEIALIQFDYNDKLINGQHTAKAIIKWGQPVGARVETGHDPELFMQLDQGKKRNSVSIGQMKVFSNGLSLTRPSLVVGGIKKLYQRDGMYPDKDCNLSSGFISDKLDENSEFFLNSELKIANWRKSFNVVSESWLAAVYYTIYLELLKNKTNSLFMADAFMDILCSSNPIAIIDDLKSTIRNNSALPNKTYSKLTQKGFYMLILLFWEYFNNGSLAKMKKVKQADILDVFKNQNKKK